MHVCVLSHALLFETPWAIACQALLSIGFFRQEYWSGLPFPPSGDLPNPGIQHASLATPALASGLSTTEPPGKPFHSVYIYQNTRCTLEIFYNLICHFYLDKAKIIYTYWILLPMQQMRVWFLGCKDPLEKKMTSNSSILAWEILWTKEPGGLWFMGSQRVGHNLVTKQQKQLNLETKARWVWVKGETISKC